MSDTKSIILGIVNNLERLDQEHKKSLCDFLVNSDYFDAPLMTNTHFAFKGGLAKYSLEVVNMLYNLLGLKIFDKVGVGNDTLEILGLFHAINKVGYYEEYGKNEKVYSPSGSKFDDLGKFDWVTTKAYKVKDAEDRFTCGDLGLNSYMILKKFIPLNDEEILAIIHYNCGMDNGHSTRDLFEILNSNPLVALLHCASMLVLNCMSDPNKLGE